MLYPLSYSPGNMRDGWPRDGLSIAYAAPRSPAAHAHALQ